MNRALPILLAGLSFGGCVSVYQPMSVLHAPVAVDTGVANFEGLTVTLHCVPKGLLEVGDASRLCRSVGRAFENQGATVTTVTSRGLSDDDLQAADSPTEVAEPADLTVELQARRVHEYSHTLMYVLSWMSFTLVPGVSEHSFAQTITIRDRQGSVLVAEEVQGRFVRYFGLGVWATNGLLNLTIRDDAEEVSEDRAKELFSADMYGQLSQMLFNANMRRKVLQAPAAAAARSGQ